MRGSLGLLTTLATLAAAATFGAAATRPALVSPTTTTSTTSAPPLVVAAPATTTAPPVIVAPTPSTTTTTSTPLIATPTTTMTSPPVIANPTTTTTAPDPIDAALGEIDTSGEVPDGLDLSAFPESPESPGAPAGGDGPTFSAATTCFNQCIRSGVAYPRGFGALLVVETYVPAELWMSVIGDTDDDGDYDFTEVTTSDGRVTELSWALDHLEPGHTYFATVVATDENHDSSHAYGSFTTLSQRTVEIAVAAPTISYGPTNLVHTWYWLKVADLDYAATVPPTELVYYSLPRHLDLALLVFREWEASQQASCGGFDPNALAPHGDSDAACGSWNTATLDDVDLDHIPASSAQWTAFSVSRSLVSWPAGVIPGPPAEPRYFHVSADVTISVTYS